MKNLCQLDVLSLSTYCDMYLWVEVFTDVSVLFHHQIISGFRVGFASPAMWKINKIDIS